MNVRTYVRTIAQVRTAKLTARFNSKALGLAPAAVAQSIRRVGFKSLTRRPVDAGQNLSSSTPLCSGVLGGVQLKVSSTSRLKAPFLLPSLQLASPFQDSLSRSLNDLREMKLMKILAMAP